jgi:hypothetical protein
MGWDIVAYNPHGKLNPHEIEIFYLSENERQDPIWSNEPIGGITAYGDPWYTGLYSNCYRIKQSWSEYGNGDPYWFVPSETNDAKEIVKIIENGILSNDKWLVKYANWLSYWIEKGAYFTLSY